MLKNLFIILIIITLYGCDTKPKKVIVETETLTIEEDDSLFKKGTKVRFGKVEVKVPIAKEGEALYENACGSEYVEALKIHEAFYGDNPPMIVFKKIPLKEYDHE
jgi:uncharacterized lipoprotein NlpE involved in copper resistance